MSNYLETELQKIIAVSEKNGKISSEYGYKFFRIFLTVSEAKEMLEIIQNHKDYHVVHSPAAS